MRSEISTWIWIIVILLLLTGAVTFGDIISFIFSFIGVLILGGLIISLIFRYRIRRAMRDADERGEEFKGYTRNFGGYQNTSRPRNPDEGKVRIKDSTQPKKRVSDDVGEYVDFKEN